MVDQELLQALQTFSVKNKSDKIELRAFIGSVRPNSTDAEIQASLKVLAGKGLCTLVPSEGPAETVVLPDYPLLLLKEEYRTLTVEPTKPFPRDDTFPAALPASEVTSVDVKGEFASFLAAPRTNERGVAKLVFPEGIDTLIVPNGFAGAELIEASVVKLSSYLSDPKNAGYVESKLISILKGSEVLVRQMVEDVAVRPKKASESVLSPSDFGFRFWTYLVNLVLQDFRKKKEKTTMDQGVCQAAFIVGYYAFFKKGQNQKEQERAADWKSLELAVRKPPYVHTYETLFALRDEKGVPFITKHSRQFISSFLEEKTKRSGDESLPYIVRIHDGSHNKDYFIQRDLLVPVFLKKLSEAAEELHDRYLNEWIAVLREHSSVSLMKSDVSFRKDVEMRVKEDYSLLTALANAPLLYIAKSETNVSEEAMEEILRCFAHDNTLRPLNEIMGLSRQMLFTEARSYLPIWDTMPVVRHFVALFRRIFSAERQAAKGMQAGRGVEAPTARSLPTTKLATGGARPAVAGGSLAARAAATTDREALARYKRAIQLLRERYVQPGKSLENTLEELAEKWNPLYAEDQKMNLVEDVNSLVRDFLRPVKRTLLASPPTMTRIQSLAEQLSDSQSLAKIKKKDPLKRYVELYMIKCLEPPRKGRPD